MSVCYTSSKASRLINDDASRESFKCKYHKQNTVMDKTKRRRKTGDRRLAEDVVPNVSLSLSLPFALHILCELLDLHIYPITLHYATKFLS